MPKKEYVMSPSEMQCLKQELKDTESVIKTAEDYGHGTRASQMLDKNELKKSAKHYSTLIRKYSPPPVSGREKDRIAKRAQELSEVIRKGMPTRSEMMSVEKNPGSPWKNLKWEKEKACAIQEWKQCQRRLEPGDPTASSVERLRRNR